MFFLYKEVKNKINSLIKIINDYIYLTNKYQFLFFNFSKYFPKYNYINKFIIYYKFNLK